MQHTHTCSGNSLVAEGGIDSSLVNANNGTPGGVNDIPVIYVQAIFSDETGSLNQGAIRLH